MSLPSSFSSVKLTAMNIKRAYKERFYPTPEQALLLAQSFGCARFVYNNTLKFRTDAYYNCLSPPLSRIYRFVKNAQNLDDRPLPFLQTDHMFLLIIDR